MYQGNVTLGKAWIWFSVLAVVLPAVVIAVFMLVAPALLGAKESVPFAGIGAIAVVVLAIMAVPGILVGRGLMRGEPWARIAALILAAVMLLHFPLGTALAVYTFIVLFADAGTLPPRL